MSVSRKFVCLECCLVTKYDDQRSLVNCLITYSCDKTIALRLHEKDVPLDSCCIYCRRRPNYRLRKKRNYIILKPTSIDRWSHVTPDVSVLVSVGRVCCLRSREYIGKREPVLCNPITVSTCILWHLSKSKLNVSSKMAKRSNPVQYILRQTNIHSRSSCTHY